MKVVRRCATPQAAKREGGAAAAEREREGGAGGHRSGGRHGQAKVRPISGTGPGVLGLEIVAVLSLYKPSMNLL